MSRGKWAGLAVAVVIALGVAWYFASPWYTLKQMRSAAEANDAAALSSYIDYPSLREDLKSDLMAQMMAEASKDKSGFGALGVATGHDVTETAALLERERFLGRASASRRMLAGLVLGAVLAVFTAYGLARIRPRGHEKLSLLRSLRL